MSRSAALCLIVMVAGIHRMKSAIFAGLPSASLEKKSSVCGCDRQVGLTVSLVDKLALYRKFMQWMPLDTVAFGSIKSTLAR